MSKRKKSGAIIESDSDDSGSEADIEEVLKWRLASLRSTISAKLEGLCTILSIITSQQ